MFRITTNKLIAAALFLVMVGGGGCARKYARRDVSADGPEEREVLAMLAALGSAEGKALEDVIARQSADQLTPLQARSLRATLTRLARAPAVELEDLARFGDDVYRASLQVRGAGGTSARVCMLLVSVDGRLRWAGQN